MKSVFPYPGGKTYLAQWVIDHFPDHDCYVEVFGGSASVLLAKEPTYVEIYNDLDGDLVHFFRVLRERDDELREYLKNVPYSREVHERWADDYFSGEHPDDDIERAARFYTLRFTQFAAKYTGNSGFSSGWQRNEAKAFHDRIEQLDDFAARLRRVQVEKKDFEYIFDRFDSEDTLFYCDPPYIEEGDALYTHGEFEHERFWDCLDELEGYFVLSYTDIPERLESYHVEERGVKYNTQRGEGAQTKDATERLVMNFDPDEVPTFAGADQSNLEAFAGADD